MEIDKKIILKLIKSLEELKESIKDIKEVNFEEKSIQEDLSVDASISSPIVGTAYLASEPGAKKFVEVGSKIKKGDTVMIIEAMKTMNHVPSSQNGVVKKVCVNDGELVEFGQKLIILE